MSVPEALRLWAELIDACPHGCRVHLTGGEAFGQWQRLIDICRRAAQQGLRPLENIETNAFWATDEAIVRRRLEALDAAGLKKLVISVDPYHQQYVPIERARLAARVAEDVLGAERLQVRWRDWLAEGFDTDTFDDAQRGELFMRYAANGRDRMNGRAAAELAPAVAYKTLDDLAGRPCRQALLRSRQVHIGPGGWIMPGTCAGILLGWANERRPVGDCWRQLNADHADRPVLAALARGGPVALARLAGPHGFVPECRYAGKCHLCWSVRKLLYFKGLYRQELGPAGIYESA